MLVCSVTSSIMGDQLEIRESHVTKGVTPHDDEFD